MSKITESKSQEFVKSRQWYKKELPHNKEIRDNYTKSYIETEIKYNEQMKKTFICAYNCQKRNRDKETLKKYKEEYKKCCGLYLELSKIFAGYLTFSDVYDTLKEEYQKYYGEFRE